MFRNADTLPVWACYDCLVLITHLPLICISFPGNMTIMLSQFARILRLQFFTLEKSFTEHVDIGNANTPLNLVFYQNGYESSSIILNLTIFLALFGIIFLAQLFAKCADCMYVASDPKKPMPNGRTEVIHMSTVYKTVNMFFRMLLFTFLELFICLLINFKVETNKDNDFEVVSRIISIFFLALMMLFVGMLFVLTAIESDP